MKSSRTKFINDLFEFSKDSKVLSNYDRYRAMGKQCKLTDYFNGHATNYLYNENKEKPKLNDLNENGFVALNVEAPALETGSSPIIPFFSIKIGNSIDSTELRNSILDISQNAAEDNFLTCPEFMNGNNGKGIKLEKVLFKVSIENNAIVSISIPKLSAFDESYTELINKDNSSLISFLSNLKNKTFLYSWCKPFMQNDQTLFCNVRAVDRDQKLVSHSIFVTIFNTEDMVKQWVSAYGEDAMNIIAVVKSIFIEDIHKKQLSESIKSAIAAIMSRNMSHNLGSHYLYYTKTQLASLAEEVGNKAPDIRGAAKVISYIQGRMDYLATIISSEKLPYGSVNFKSQIWDELTVDDFSRRHYPNTEPIQLSKMEYDDQLLDIRNLLKQTEKLKRTYDIIEPSNTPEDFVSIGADIKMQIDKMTTKIGETYGKISKGGVNRRTTNFLLANLILSENYSRPGIIDAKLGDGKFSLQLFASLWDENKQQFELFTGTDNNDISKGRTMSDEEEVKTRLSRLDLALPGGTMSCHAFFNILENFIRNSAKYSWSKRCKHNDLIFTVALKVDHKTHTIEFTIFDNKRDAYKKRENCKLIHSLKSRLSSLVILGENNTVDKNNKGLKEMLFSAVWLRANEFDESLSAIFSKIQEASYESKLELIKTYAFEFVSVDQNGLPCCDSRRANLGIRFTLPIFKRSEKLRIKKVQLTQLLRLHTDIIDILSTQNSKWGKLLGRPYEHVFPRICYSDISVLDSNQLTDMPVLDKTDKEAGLDILRLRYAIQKNLGRIDDYLLTMNGTDEPVITTKRPTDNLHIIRFDTHFSTKLTINQLRKEFYGKFVYVDSISGNNSSKTLEGMFKSGLVIKGNRRLYASWRDMYLALKIKEAALTHITIIDERLFNSIQWKVSSQGKVDIRKSAYELSMQNIRVLNFYDSDICKQATKMKHSSSLPKNPLVQVSGFPLLCGNEFLPNGLSSSYPNGTHFLSIHLGLIEKILKSDRANYICGEKGDNALSEERVLKFMEEIKNIFSFPNRHLHICIHSGRGNYSNELAGPLKEYPFISLAALESSFNNSKYLLAQLFYNTIYIGKGEIN